jgi:hypothetical protein
MKTTFGGFSLMPPENQASVGDPPTSDQELFDQMTELSLHWVANQSWLMFGFPQP